MFKMLQNIQMAAFGFVGFGAVYLLGLVFGLEIWLWNDLIDTQWLIAATLLVILFVCTYGVINVVHEIAEINDKLAGRSDDVSTGLKAILDRSDD